jgi:hypothetical protein
MARFTYEKPQRTNPHRLTIDQHVFPTARIKRFTNQLGRVCVFDIARNKPRPAKPNDSIFLAKRVWDQRTEAAMKCVEDAFQPLALDIIAGRAPQIDNAAAKIVRDFSALWFVRARHRHLPEQETQLQGFIGGGGLTRDQEEMAEANGCAFIRADGRMPTRCVNGRQILSETIRFSKSLASVPWGIVRAHEGEFLVPDNPDVPACAFDAQALSRGLSSERRHSKKRGSD